MKLLLPLAVYAAAHFVVAYALVAIIMGAGLVLEGMI